jgi:hypothetical protein
VTRSGVARDPLRQQAASEAEQLRGRHPGWNIQAVRISRGWRVAAVADEDQGDGGTSAVIGTAAEVEAAITGRCYRPGNSRAGTTCTVTAQPLLR